MATETETKEHGHAVTVDPNGDAQCTCKRFGTKERVFGRHVAMRVAHAHVANPDLSTMELMAFVVKRPGE